MSILKCHVLRTDISQYLSDSFVELEKKSLLRQGVTDYSFGLESTKVKLIKPNIWITSSNTKVREIWENNKATFEDVKLIIHPNSGYDNFDFEFVKNFSKDKGQIILGNELRAQAVVEYILKGIFDYYNISENNSTKHSIPRSLHWDNKRVFKRSLLQNKNILIIGYGIIGSKLNMTLNSLGIKTFIYDPFKSYDQMPDLSSMDIVCVAASLNKTSKNLINNEFLKSLPKNFLLINASRGEIVDLKALINILSLQPSSFALIDVYDQEPYDFKNFEAISNFHGTSHIAGVYNSLENNMIDFESKVVDQFLSNINLSNQFPILKDRIMNDFLL